MLVPVTDAAKLTVKLPAAVAVTFEAVVVSEPNAQVATPVHEPAVVLTQVDVNEVGFTRAVVPVVSVNDGPCVGVGVTTTDKLAIAELEQPWEFVQTKVYTNGPEATVLTSDVSIENEPG